MCVDKFKTDLEYFVFGDIRTDYVHGLTKKIPNLSRSMSEECLGNDGGKWREEFLYVTEEAAFEKVLDASQPHRVRDKGHAGMRLADFCRQPEAVQAGLTEAEVAALRMYTGPMYVPFNGALRGYNEAKPETVAYLRSWGTTISVLYAAVLKLSTLTTAALGVLLRGVNESVRRLPESFVKPGADGYAGGVELAFMSTTTDEAVAVESAPSSRCAATA